VGVTFYDFRTLAAHYEVSGGDIKNAVLKAASAAAAEPGSDRGKLIHQEHFERAMADVIAARSVMQQSLFGEHHALDPIAPFRRAVVAAVVLAASAFVAAVIALALIALR
jgi:hypothetical protein